MAATKTKRAKLLYTWTRKVSNNTPRAVHAVECACKFTNNFDALSWGGHRVLRCKNPACRLYIDRRSLICAPTRALAKQF